MVVKNARIVDSNILTVEGAPADVDAGAEFSFICRVALSPKSDPSGLAVSIRDHDNAELASAELSMSGGDCYATDEIFLKAPLTDGEYICRAFLVAGNKAHASFDTTSTEFSVVVKAHSMRLNVWDLPSAIVAGESLTLKAGLKCSAGCNLASREVCIFDGDGIQIGDGKLCDEVWPGTSALYFAEVECKAPLAVGNHKWELRFTASDLGVPHAAGAAAFDIKIVDPPDCEVTIEAFDAGSQTPISGAHVVMHPYRALTGENGVAKLNVVKGKYELLVSAPKCLATARAVEVAENVSIRAELTLEPVLDSSSFYV